VAGPDLTSSATEVEAVLGDITAEEVDAVVNAANAALAPGAGVCGAIFAAAGAARLEAACRDLGGCSPGDAKATSGFSLAARWIIHTVGPVWRGGGEGEDELLASCYRRSLEVADGLGARSVAFPAISTGIYGFPPDRAAAIAVDAVRGAGCGVRLVRLVAFDPATLDRYRRLLGGDPPAGSAGR
jgi:O-acetyl-ADP-ribose deacetylase (regulator of RNase III)